MPDDSIWRILLVEDDEEDYILARSMLAEMQGKSLQLEWARQFDAGRNALSTGSYDVVLMDYDLGSHTGLELIREAVANKFPAPIILLTGRGSHDVDVEAMQAGATLYLTKSEINPLLLERAIRYAMQMKRSERERAQILDSIQDGFIALNQNWCFTFANRRAAQLTGLDTEALIGRNIWETFPQLLGAPIEERARYVMAKRKAVKFEAPGADNKSWYSLSIHPFHEGISIFWEDITERKQADDTLRDREETLRLALAAGGAGAWSWDLRSNELHWSDEYYRIFGYQPGSVAPSAEAGFAHIHPDDLAETKDLVRSAIEKGTQIDTIHRVLWPDGSMHWVRGISRAFYDASGNPYRMAGIAIDITEHKHAEADLQSANRRTIEILESISDAFYSLDHNGYFTYINQKAANLWNQQPADLIGKNIWDVFPNGRHTESYQRIQQALADGCPAQYESYSQFLDQWVDIHLYPGEKGISVYFQDITERKRSEKAYHERSQRLAFLFEATSELLKDRDPEEYLNHIYPRLAALLDLEVHVQYYLSADGKTLELGSLSGFSKKSRKALKRLKVGEAVCGNVARTLQPKIIADVQASQDPATHFIRAEGITAYGCFPLKAHDRLIGTLSFGSRRRTHFDPEAIAMFQTVSELISTAIDRWRSGINLQTYAGQLERQNRDLQEFAFVASHDLQEPLRKIEMFGDMLLKASGNLSEQQRDYLARMHTSAGRMRSMITGLLELSRLERSESAFEAVDLNQVVHEVLADLEVKVLSTGAQVAISPLPVVDADRLQMRQLFQNLLDNALKYQLPGSLPRVSVASRSQNSGQVEIAIVDNGIGILPDANERIFQPFQRAVGKSQYPGTGMGLAICRRIVERHGGHISVSSQLGHGSKFLIVLPAALPEADDLTTLPE